MNLELGGMVSKRPREYQTKADYVADRLRQDAADGRLQPGQRLRLVEVARELNLSVTPVREAFQQLAHQGLLSYAPHRETRVAEYSPERLVEVFTIRAALESRAVELAAQNLTSAQISGLSEIHAKMAEHVTGRLGDGRSELRQLNAEFHFIIYEAAPWKLLLNLVRQAWAAAPHDLFGESPERGPLTLSDHQRILDALREGDGASAGDAMTAHIMRSLKLHTERLQGTQQGAD